DMDALTQIDAWPVGFATAAVVSANGVIASRGDTGRVVRLASISKPLAAWACMIAVEEGTASLDDAVGQPGCTLRHLLAHAGGYGFDGPNPITRPERRRIYSNTGIELAAGAIQAASGIGFADYLREAVFEPLGMDTALLRGSPAHGVRSSAGDLTRFATELLAPRLVTADTAAMATAVQFPALSGMVPGIGSFDPCPWSLGFEVHGAKYPHWMGTSNSPATYGHFGGSGTMFWVDPEIGVALIALTDRAFDEWAAEATAAWRSLSNAVIANITSR
ncbi:MAG TPA: serine hydrolase domain-containing protein, partial [Ilumatobacteraceae bacterium]|nr:serine hydrolase domain-containing protein [Ilumatobacteraceae bacterium]